MPTPAGVGFDITSLIVLAGACVLFPLLGSRVFRLPSAWLRSVARRPAVSLLVVALVSFAANVAVTLLHGVPAPQIRDEISQTLAAETFALGRLTNPPHPLWEHFESVEIIQQPTYQSKYPPGQALLMALGLRLGGRAILGVWIGLALGCGALCWMLRAWTSPAWALRVGLIVAVSPTVVKGWGQSYWGGGVAMLGGALVLGALRRLVRGPRARDACLLAAGVAVLANTRPYEGLVVGAAAAAVLSVSTLRGPRDSLVALVKAGVPGLLLLAAVACWMGYFNDRVTGSPLVLPYQVWYRTYVGGPGVVRELALGEEVDVHRPVRTVPGTAHTGFEETDPESRERALRETRLGMLVLNAAFYFPSVLGLGLAGLALAVRERWTWFAVATTTAVLAAVFSGRTIFAPHYLAPIAPLLMALFASGLRRLHAIGGGGRRPGRWFVRALLATFLAVSCAHLVRHGPPRLAWTAERARIVEALDAMPGRHIVLVRYDGTYRTRPPWVYNGPDIDAAKVVWAHSRGARRNRRLLEHFRDRRAWCFDVDLTPRAFAPCGDSPAARAGGASGGEVRPPSD